MFDWGEIGPLFVFCAVLAWSRFRFVFFADNLGADATMAALAQCMETIGGVPKTLLTDRMGCLKGGTVAGLVIPTPDYVRFVTHYGTRPDFCQGADPESKGIVEALVGYVKSDLMIPEELSVADLTTANAKGVAWCAEVNAQVHSEIAAIPIERLALERPLLGDLPSLRARIGKVAMRKVDRLSCVRFGSARYSVPNIHIGRQVELRVADGTVMIVFLGEIIAEHGIVAPGETSVSDQHYAGAPTRPQPGGAAQDSGRGGVRRSRAGSRGVHQRGCWPGCDHLGRRSQRPVRHGGRPRQRRAHRRGRTGGRVRSVPGSRCALNPRRRKWCPTAPCAGRRPHRRPARCGHPLPRQLRHGGEPMSTTPPALAPDLESGLRRLRLGAMRALCPQSSALTKLRHSPSLQSQVRGYISSPRLFPVSFQWLPQ